MKISKYHSHLNGREWILVHEPTLWKEIEEVISRVDAHSCMTKVSKEKTMKGKLLYSPTDLNVHFKRHLNKRGWSEVRTEQLNFKKNRIAVQTQIGKCSLTHYELVIDNIGLYLINEIDVGVEILPMKAMKRQMPSACGHYEETMAGIVRQGRNTPSVPLVIVGVEP